MSCSVIAADVLYFEVQVHPLIHTLQRRLKSGGFALFLVTVRARTTATVHTFEKALRSSGFEVSCSDAKVRWRAGRDDKSTMSNTREERTRVWMAQYAYASLFETAPPARHGSPVARARRSSGVLQLISSFLALRHSRCPSSFNSVVIAFLC